MLKQYLKIINWKEYLSLSLHLLVLKYNFLNNFGFKTSLSYPYFFALLFSLLSIVIIGDFLTYNSSHIKKKFKKEKTKKNIFYLVYLLISFLTNLYISYKINKYEPIWVFGILLGISFLYITSKYKKTLLNNIILASFKPLSIIFIWYIDFPLDANINQWQIILKLEIILLYIIILSFTGNFIKHVLIDFKNKKRDLKLNYKTLPIVFGEKRTKKILVVTIAISHLLTVLMTSLLLNNTTLPYNIIIFLYLFMTTLQLFFGYLIIKAKQKEDYNKIMRKITNASLLGLVIFPLITYLLKNAL